MAIEDAMVLARALRAADGDADAGLLRYVAAPVGERGRGPLRRDGGDVHRRRRCLCRGDGPYRRRLLELLDYDPVTAPI